MRYLIPEFTGLGDIIQKTPMMKGIRDVDPEAELILIGDNRWGGLSVVENSPLVDEVHNIMDILGLRLPEEYANIQIASLYRSLTRLQTSRLREWLCEARWDVFFDDQHSDIPPILTQLIEECSEVRIFRHADVSDTARAPTHRLFRPRKPVARVTKVPILRGRHDIDSNFDLLEYCCEHPLDRAYETWVSLEICSEHLKKWTLSSGDYFCIQPGAANGAQTPKTWHPDNFVTLAQQLVDIFGVKVVLVGDTGDQEHIISKREWPAEVINTAGCTTIEELGTLIGDAGCVIAHDSGVMHLANAMGVPLVALYGPTDYTATRPLGNKSRILFSKTPAFAAMYCSDMSEKKLSEKYPNNQAMSGIKVDQVISVIKTLLDVKG